METHSNALAWKIPQIENPSRLYSPWHSKELDRTERLTFSLSRFLFQLSFKSPSTLSWMPHKQVQCYQA